MSDLYVDYLATTLTVGCCANNVAAVIFNQDHDALKLISTPPDVWAMAAYTNAGHDDFCIPLAEHAERTFYYHETIDSTEFTLAATPEGEFYFIEYWHKSGGGVFVRDTDDLLDSKYVIWDGNYLAESRLPATQIETLQGYVVQASVTYDPTSQTVYMIGWLEKNNALVTDTQYITFDWRDRNGAGILSATISTYMTSSDNVLDGIFKLDYPGIDLDPDLVTPMVVTIRDVDNNDHVSCVGIATWD